MTSLEGRDELVGCATIGGGSSASEKYATFKCGTPQRMTSYKSKPGSTKRRCFESERLKDQFPNTLSTLRRPFACWLKVGK